MLSSRSESSYNDSESDVSSDIYDLKFSSKKEKMLAQKNKDVKDEKLKKKICLVISKL